jgi:hypothetical protein
MATITDLRELFHICKMLGSMGFRAIDDSNVSKSTVGIEPADGKITIKTEKG